MWLREGGLGVHFEVGLIYFRSFLLRAMQSAELRRKVALGEECLQEAFNETMSLREEITKRKQHGEVLLARIRFLKVQFRRLGCKSPTCCSIAEPRTTCAERVLFCKILGGGCCGKKLCER